MTFYLACRVSQHDYRGVEQLWVTPRVGLPLPCGHSRETLRSVGSGGETLSGIPFGADSKERENHSYPLTHQSPFWDFIPRKGPGTPTEVLRQRYTPWYVQAGFRVGQPGFESSLPLLPHCVTLGKPRHLSEPPSPRL